MRSSLLGISVLLFDQLTKHFARVKKKFIIENSGLPFGINLPGFFDALLVAGLFFAFVFIFLKYWRMNVLARFGFALILGGAVSNLLDRLIRGSVTDFLNFGITTMNFADLAIIGGIALLIINKSGTRNRKSQPV